MMFKYKTNLCLACNHFYNKLTISWIMNPSFQRKQWLLKGLWPLFKLTLRAKMAVSDLQWYPWKLCLSKYELYKLTVYFHMKQRRNSQFSHQKKDVIKVIICLQFYSLNWGKQRNQIKENWIEQTLEELRGQKCFINVS